MDFSRLRSGELAAGLGGIALFVFLFFDWYGGGVAFDEGGGVKGWDALGVDVTGFIVALTAVAGVALPALAAADRKVNAPVPRGCGTATLGALSVAIILWRLLANFEFELKIGIFLGLLAALAITAGAVIALREDGFEPLVAASGGRRASSRATAPRRRATRTTGARKTTKRSGSRKTTATRRATGGRKGSSGSRGSRGRSSTRTRRTGGGRK